MYGVFTYTLENGILDVNSIILSSIFIKILYGIPRNSAISICKKEIIDIAKP